MGRTTAGAKGQSGISSGSAPNVLGVPNVLASVDPVLARVAAALDVGAALGGAEAALNVLRTAAGADDAELFLADRASGTLILAACEGLDRNALLQQTLFERGAGYPGMVAERRRTLSTRHVERDPSYLRQDVKDCGVRAYVCAPLLANDRVVGSVNLAWHRSDAPLDAARELLERTSGILATLALANRAMCSLRAHEAVSLARSTPGNTLLKQILGVMQSWSQAADATLIRFDSSPSGPQVVSAVPAPFNCATALDGGSCPCATRGTPLLLGAEETSWPAECRASGPQGAPLCCVPVPGVDRTRAVVVLHRLADVTSPPALQIMSVVALAQEVAPFIEAPGAVPSPSVADASAARLAFRCMGHFEIERNARPIDATAFGRRRALTLLKLLILKRGRPAHRDALIEKLWPDCGTAAGANRLHGLVHVLRSVLEPVHCHRRGALIRQHDAYYWIDLPSPDVYVDLLEFHALAARVWRRGRIDDANRREELERMIALYRGDLFEEGTFAECFSAEREALREELVRAVRELARIERAGGDVDRATEVLRTGLRMAPLDENLHSALISEYADQGRRNSALEQYRLCAQVLRQALDVEPSAETREVARRAGLIKL